MSCTYQSFILTDCQVYINWLPQGRHLHLTEGSESHSFVAAGAGKAKLNLHVHKRLSGWSCKKHLDDVRLQERV